MALLVVSTVLFIANAQKDRANITILANMAVIVMAQATFSTKEHQRPPRAVF